ACGGGGVTGVDVEHTKALAAKFDPAAPSQYLAKLGREVVAAVERVQALHTPWTNPTGHPYCKECLLAHPCPTIRALGDGK
uniref:hypothetical protein n=1 Tax=Rhodococcus sp. T9N TaxID=627445 RepID=UPI0021C448FE